MDSFFNQTHRFRATHYYRHRHSRKKNHVPQRENRYFATHFFYTFCKILIHITLGKDRHYNPNIIIQIVVRLFGKPLHSFFHHILFPINCMYRYNKRAKVTVFSINSNYFCASHYKIVWQILISGSKSLQSIMINVR